MELRQNGTDDCSSPERLTSSMTSSSRTKMDYAVQQSPTSVVATTTFSPVVMATGGSLSISLVNGEEVTVTKDLPMLEYASDSQESDGGGAVAAMEREFRCMMECALWQQKFLLSRTSKLVQLLWGRQWERLKRRLLRHRDEVREESELPCFFNCRGWPLHLACAMRPLPPAAVIQMLIDAHPDAAQIPERTWGLLPLHLVSDLRFQKRTGGGKGQPCRQGEEGEVHEDDVASTDSSTDSDSVSEVFIEDTDARNGGGGAIDNSDLQTLANGCSPAAHHGKIVEIILNAFPEGVKAREKLSGMLPVHIAACTGYSQNGLVSETTFIVLELLLKDAPETRWIKDDWGHSAVYIAWQETVFHCSLCEPEGSERCPHVWSLPQRFINPLFRTEKSDLKNRDREGAGPTKESDSEKRSTSFPSFITIPIDVTASVASAEESLHSRPNQISTVKFSPDEDALLRSLIAEAENDNDYEDDDSALLLYKGNRVSTTIPAVDSGVQDSAGSNSAIANHPTDDREDSQSLPKNDHELDAERNQTDSEPKAEKSDEKPASKKDKKHYIPIGKDVLVDNRFGPFGDRFGADSKSLLTIRIQVSHLKAGKGKGRFGALVNAPNPFVEMAVVAKGKKTTVYQSHPLMHRSEATWDAQQISLGLSIKSMYKSACLFTVYHCRRKGGAPLLIGTYYCAFKDLPTTPVLICRGGKTKGQLCVNSFSLEEIPKPCCDKRVQL